MPATEILPNLYLGTREDAEALGRRVPESWACISVTEYRSRYKRKEELPNEPVGSLDMPFMVDWPDGWHADPHKLDLIAETIWWKLQSGKKVLVHCIHAQERAPLAVVWYLAWSGAAPSIVRAYEMVTKLHPRTQRRDLKPDKPDKHEKDEKPDKTDKRDKTGRGDKRDKHEKDDKPEKTDNRQDWLRGASPKKPRPELSMLLDAARELSSVDPQKRAAALAALEAAAVAWAAPGTGKVPAA